MIDIKTIKTWPNDAVVEQIQGKVTGVYERRDVPGRDNTTSTVQNADFQDGTGEKIRLTVWNHPDLKPLEGMEVNLASRRAGNGKFGGVSVKHGSFVAKKDTKNYKAGDTVTTLELSVSKLGSFQKVGTSSQNAAQPEPANTQTPNATSNGPKTQGTGAGACSATKSIHGATIGMALNQACANLTARGEELHKNKVWVIASSIVKLALYMEAGNLHEPKKLEEAPKAENEEDVPF